MCTAMTRYEQIKADPEKYRKHLANARKWSLANKDKVAASVRRWQRNNADKVNARQRERYQNDPKHRQRMSDYQSRARREIGGYLRQRLRSWLHLARNGCVGKASRFVDVVTGKPGYVQSFEAETVDHIAPLIAFDLTDSVQLRKAMHWSNLRPCSARENMVKGDSNRPATLDGLPYVDTPEAQWEAEAFIRYCHSRMIRLPPMEKPA